ncbi:hypothetical protein GCM10010211_25170 [Streptomyces albospinus]|uniref:DUF11 domain-containing protein n=1 Tax=Streptomyces albospinus TaxID=285515 RepID=A0ABQ2UZF8_9ACTN|nr:hypothetical protein [Streptomyces albospinus]GGU59227.1 hypothetical protein GCM10010211_25170 [Streptomyces albospinus]
MRTAAACALLYAATLPAPTAAAPAPPAVSVSVSVTDGVDRAESGRRLDYRVTVHNLGANDVHRARIEQEMPATTISATADGGTVDGHGMGEQKAVWHADLPAHDIQVFTAGAVLGAPRAPGVTAAPGTLRAASTVCVYAGPSAAPTACSGNLDDLPESRSEPERRDGWVWWGVAALVCAVFVPGAVRTIRRGRARRAG